MCTTCGCRHEHDEHQTTRLVAVEEDILARNQADAALARAYFRKNRILALNLVSSPGSGKTELLAATLQWPTLKALTMSVIEGDLKTDNDAERIRRTGARAVQINTGRGCHLSAEQVLAALGPLQPSPGSIVFIENVGNLVCPAEFDLGEAHKVVLLSVTEGDDKPLKYPDLFAAADLMIINKIDLLPYVSFSLERCEENARRVNPRLTILRTSATTGEGLPDWARWLLAQSAPAQKRGPCHASS